MDEEMNVNLEDYFKIIQGGLDTDKIDEFLKSIDPSHLTSAELDAKVIEINKKIDESNAKSNWSSYLTSWDSV